MPDMEVVAEVSSERVLGETLGRHRPELLIMDSEMATHAETVSDLAGIRLLLLTARPRPGALPAGLFVCGSIGARDGVDQIHRMLDTVGHCAGADAGRDNCAQCVVGAAFTPMQALPLSLRESQVLALLGEGMGTSEIAATLSRSVKTIEAHRENIKRKLGLGNAIELIDAARGWLRGETIDLPLPAAAAGGRQPSDTAL